MKRFLTNLLAVLSLLMCIGVLVFWVRTRMGTDHLEWSYDRYLADRSAASTQIYLNTERNRLWLSVSWGRVAPFNGQLVWGYYMRADQSGGKPQLKFTHGTYKEMDAMLGEYYDPDSNASGWGPLRWQSVSHSKAKEGDDSRFVRIGMSYWLSALILLILPALRVKHYRQARRARLLGLCRRCGYDLRASVDRCPECGTTP